MKAIQFFLLLSLSACDAFAQAPDLQAENSFGGSSNEHAHCIQSTKDGGYIMAGSTESHDGDVHGNHGEDDFWVVKLDRHGAIQWQKTLGGVIDEKAFSVQQTFDGGYIVAGEANSNEGQVRGNHGRFDYWVVKLDSSGDIDWQRSLGGSKDDFATCIRQTKDSGYIVVGGSFSADGQVTGHHGMDIYSDCWVVKLGSSGHIQWQHSYGGTSGDVGQDVQETNDGGYVVAGNATSNDGDVRGVHDPVYGDAWIIKISRTGDLQWQHAFGGSDYEQANSILQTTDDGYVFAGWTRSANGDVSGNHGNYDFWVVKLDKKGTLQWQKCAGGTGGDLAYGIRQTKNGDYIVAGGTGSNDGDVTGLHGHAKEDFWVIKLDSRGAIQWQKALGGTAYEEARSIALSKDGGCVVAGSSGFSGVNNGDVTGNHGNYDCWVAKLSSADIANTNTVQQDHINICTPQISIAPNPAISFVNITVGNASKATLRITNGSRHIIYENSTIAENATIRVDVSSYTPAIYYVQLIRKGTVIGNAKFIK